ncbi:hypothetical protein [Streptacidiphilus carbonis]|uniref:hypothetical protein n=1 Tax=Streptacidiphilus carbonis TaxID=105422 RepID=UPI000AD78F5F|nr:hypothetical protein [Streptacidiphilus carbonis]
MPRPLHYFLIWLSCTALTATAVLLTVRFVVGSTTPLPPTARGVSTVLATGAAVASAGAAPSAVTGSPAPAPSSPAPSPSHRQQPSRPSAPASQSPSAAPPHHSGSADCSGGAGAHSFESAGGQVTVRFGADAVCLVSAVPGLGFTTSTTQSAPDTLTVTFTGAHHRSELTASLQPQAQEVTREVSW